MGWRELAGAVDQPPAPRGDSGSIADTALDYTMKAGGALLGPPLKALEAFGDYWTRPQVATSEAYGEYEKTGDISEALGAGWRGLTKGYKRAEHPLWEERIVPYEEDEGFGRMAKRMAAGALTDPLMFAAPLTRFAVPVARGAGRLAAKIPGVGRAAEAGGQAVRAKVAAAKAHPWTQVAARYVAPSNELAPIFGGRAGAEVGEGIARADFRVTLEGGQSRQEIAEAMEQLGLTGDAGRLEQVTRVLENPGLRGEDRTVDAAADFFRGKFDEFDRRVSSYRDQYGEVVTVWDEALGEAVPYASEENYVPWMLKKEIQDQRGLRDPGPAAKRMARMNRLLSEKKAQEILGEQAVRAKKAGHIENLRTSELPESMREMNIVELFERYSNQVNRRLAHAEEWGLDWRGLEKRLKESGTEGGMGGILSNDIQEDLLRQAKGIRQASPSDDLVNNVLAFQAVSKLGPTTTIMNTGQKLNDLIRQGVVPFFKGLRGSLKSENRSLYAASWVSQTRDYLQEVAGASAGGGTMLQRLPGKYLKGVGFTGTEEMNRIGSSVAGVNRAEQLARQTQSTRPGQAAKAWEELVQRRVTPDDVEEYLQTNSFSTQTKQAIGLRESQITQHATSASDLPAGWASPQARVLMQFKRFAYHQSRFLYKDVAKPAWKWMDSGGKKGDIRPMMRAMVAYSGGGMTIATARDALRDMQTWALGAKGRVDHRDYDNHPIGQMLKDMTYVGSFGIAGDAFERFSRGQGAGWVLGPTYSDTIDMTERAFMAAKATAMSDDAPTFEDLALNIYRYGGRGLLGLTPTQLPTVGSRGLPRAVKRGWRTLVDDSQ